MSARANCSDCGWSRLYRRPVLAHKAAARHRCDPRELRRALVDQVDAVDLAGDSGGIAGVVPSLADVRVLAHRAGYSDHDRPVVVAIDEAAAVAAAYRKAG
ncbi:MAG TPA: hypothetical protein VGJ44_20245 [Kribbellaceae bacterium]|jgi:hypothetical protein